MKNETKTESKFSEWKEKKNALYNKIEKNMSEKRYVCTIIQEGDIMMSGGDIDRQVNTKRFFKICSTSELPEVLQWTRESFWTHPDFGKIPNDKIPSIEKKWGIYTDVIIEPFTEELEESYLNASKQGFFENQRMYHEYLVSEAA